MSAHKGSAWQEAMDLQRERTARAGHSNCGHPGCSVVDASPRDLPQCALSRPISVSVPRGKHAHVACQVHGDHVIRG